MVASARLRVLRLQHMLIYRCRASHREPDSLVTTQQWTSHLHQSCLDFSTTPPTCATRGAALLRHRKIRNHLLKAKPTTRYRIVPRRSSQGANARRMRQCRKICACGYRPELSRRHREPHMAAWTWTPASALGAAALEDSTPHVTDMRSADWRSGLDVQAFHGSHPLTTHARDPRLMSTTHANNGESAPLLHRHTSRASVQPQCLASFSFDNGERITHNHTTQQSATAKEAD